MIEVMLPLSLLVGAGAVWPLSFRDTDVEAMRTQLNRLVMYLFYPLHPVRGRRRARRSRRELLSVPLLVGIGSLASGACSTCCCTCRRSAADLPIRRARR